MRHLTTAALVLAALAAACSGDSVSEAQCKEFAAHFESLMNGPGGSETDKTRQVASQMVPEMLRRCLDEGTPAQLKCGLAATDMEQFRACGEKR